LEAQPKIPRHSDKSQIFLRSILLETELNILTSAIARTQITNTRYGVTVGVLIAGDWKTDIDFSAFNYCNFVA
jgi:hypothetical protein